MGRRGRSAAGRPGGAPPPPSMTQAPIRDIRKKGRFTIIEESSKTPEPAPPTRSAAKTPPPPLPVVAAPVVPAQPRSTQHVVKDTATLAPARVESALWQVSKTKGGTLKSLVNINGTLERLDDAWARKLSSVKIVGARSSRYHFDGQRRGTVTRRISPSDHKFLCYLYRNGTRAIFPQSGAPRTASGAQPRASGKGASVNPVSPRKRRLAQRIREWGDNYRVKA